MNSGRSVFLLCALLLCSFSCSEPAAYEHFEKGTETHEFTLPLTDTTAFYDLYFYTRVDRVASLPDSVCSMRLDVDWYAPQMPDSVVFSESVYLPYQFGKGEMEPYRTRMALRPAGEWTVKVNVPRQPEGYRGIGMICKKNGTR